MVEVERELPATVALGVRQRFTEGDHVHQRRDELEVAKECMERLAVRKTRHALHPLMGEVLWWRRVRLGLLGRLALGPDGL